MNRQEMLSQENDRTTTAQLLRYWQHSFRRGKQILQEAGVKSFGIQFLRKIGIRWEVLLERPFNTPLVDVTPKVPVTIEILDETHLTEYLTFRPNADPLDIGQRFVRGQLCIVARHQGSIVNSDWMTTGRNEPQVWIRYLERELSSAPDEVYGYDSFTAPEFRRLNIASARSLYMQQTMRDAGYTRLVGLALPENEASLRRMKRAHYRRIGVLGSVHIGSWHWHFSHVRRGERPPGAKA